jgi:hypothetical protein
MIDAQRKIIELVEIEKRILLRLDRGKAQAFTRNG